MSHQIDPTHLMSLDSRPGRSDGITIGQVFSTLRRRLLVLMSIVLGITLIGYFIVKSLTPTFTATAMILLYSKQDNVVDLQKAFVRSAGGQSVILSELDALRARGLVDRLIDQEDLTNDPEFNVYARPFDPNLFVRWGIADHLPRFLQPYFRNRPLDPSRFSADQLRYSLETRVLAAYTVTSDIKTYTVDINFTSVEAAKAARLANSLVDEYLKSQIDQRVAIVERAASQINPRLAELSQKTAQADRAVEEFKAANHIIDLPSSQSAGNTLALREIENLSEGLNTARTTRARLEAAQQEVQQLQADPEQSLSAPAVAAAPLVENLRVQEVTTAARLASLMGVYGERHPLVVAAKEELQKLRQRLDEEVARAVKQLDVQLREARSNETQLQIRMAELTRTRDSENRVVPRLRQLEAAQKAAKEVYDAFVQGLARADSQDGIPTPMARIIQSAGVLDRPTYPNSQIALAVIFIAALMIAAATVFALEATDKSFHNADEFEETIGLPVLGMTLRAYAPLFRTVLRPPRTQVARQVVASPTSAMSETVRLVRSAITFSRSDRRPKIIMVTSSAPGEGKTTLSLMLARQTALSGKRAIVIEAELRKPSFAKDFGPLRSVGLSEYLLGEATLEEVIGLDESSGAHFISVGKHKHSGAINRFSAELLGSARMEALLRELSSRYDLVLLDTPPATVVADALHLGAAIDAAILVVKWGSTPRHLVLDAVKKLRASNVPLVGAVMTQVDARRYKSYANGALPHEFGGAYYAASS
jgi:capsular exopolysaccharide synthesis family protein